MTDLPARIFVANSTTLVAERIQGALECADRALRDGLSIVLAQHRANR